MTIPLVGPDGREYELDDESQLDSLRAQGFRTPDESPLSPVEQGIEMFKTGVTSAGRGFTAGLSDAVLDEQSARENARLVAEYPDLALGAELAGAIASPVNKAASLVTKGIGATTRLGRIGANIAGGAASGLLFGAGKTVSDAALGDTELTAEKLIAGGGLGMLLGGAGGGVGGVIEEGARVLLPAARTLAGRAASALDDIANDAALSQTRATRTALKSFTDDELQAAVKMMRERGHFATPEKLRDLAAADRDVAEAALLKELGLDVGGLNRRMLRDDARAALEKGAGSYGEKIGAALKEVDDLGWARPEFSKFRERFDAFRSSLNPAERDNIKAALKRVQGFLDDMGSKPVGSKENGFAALNDLKSTLQKEINYKVEDNVRIGLKKRLVGILRDEIDSQIEAQVGGRLSGEFVAAKKAFASLSRADDALSRASATGTDAIEALAAAAGLASPSLDAFRTLGTIERLAESGIGRTGGVGLKDLMAGDLLGHVAGPFGIAGAIGTKVLREQGPAIVARIADRLAKEPALKAMAASFAATLPNVAPKLGPYAAVLAQELRVSPERALASHIAHSQLDPSYAATAQLAGLTPEEPDEAPAALARAQTVAEAQAASAAFDQRLKQKVEQIGRAKGEPAASSVFKSQDFGAKRMRREDGYEQRVKEVRMLATDPQALLDRVAANISGLGSVAPSLTMAMNSAAARAVEYLTQQAEVPPQAGPMAPEWDVPQADRYTFSLKLEAVQDPMSVLERAADGSLVEEQVEAVRAVYPKLYQSIQMAALERMTDGRPVPYKAKVMLSILTGIDPDGTLSPLAIAANQTAIMASGKKSDAPGAPLGGPPGEPGEGDVTLASRSATPSQRREMRDEV